MVTKGRREWQKLRHNTFLPAFETILAPFSGQRRQNTQKRLRYKSCITSKKSIILFTEESKGLHRDYGKKVQARRYKKTDTLFFNTNNKKEGGITE